MIGRHEHAKDELKKFKTLLNEFGNTPVSDDRSKMLLHDALLKLGSTVQIILMDIQNLNEESPANKKPE
ncbi:hypothetical protein [Pseudomonas sp. Y24-6]|uniref:hypothetical protein n=1 Tax=Pseudomonas sp. Y24-6 TaxID=2750013 RepID=UPI001CE1E619|nr:hypothetical protein [Pseudomonas sp. Y24-6]MCA4960992.1 hypothetical protein [Pseudomonas sp. Y24-6]